MPIEKGPPLELLRVVTKSFVPPGGLPYRVRDGDDWKKLAAKYHVNVKALIHFNFHTTDSAIVNWYLHYKVGCVKVTTDGFNWMFSDAADPGIIHFPPGTSGLPPCNPLLDI